ncbi:MAG: TIGR04255 family protein [Rhodanobacteraceae bacterium]
MTDKRPPVFLTIAAVTHEPLKALGGYIPQIQDSLRKLGYSGQLQESTLSHLENPLLVALPAGMKPAAVENTYSVFTADTRSAFTFNDQGIFAYHTTAYTTRAALFKQVRMGLEIFHQHVQLQTLRRVGARMLDLIRPSDSGHTVASYVAPSFRGFEAISATEGWATGLSTFEQRFSDGDAEVIAKFDCLPDGFGLRADIMSTMQGHALPPHLTSVPGVLHAILDIDSGTRASIEPRAFSIDAVMDELGGHKDRISRLFRASVTPLALSEWGLQ